MLTSHVGTILGWSLDPKTAPTTSMPIIHITGFDESFKFIGKQEPMSSTFNDFWSMIWQENSRVIVMLNGTKEQSEPWNIQYFASTQDNVLIKELIIREERIELNSHYTKTTLNVMHINTGEIRVIKHLSTWTGQKTKLQTVKCSSTSW